MTELVDTVEKEEKKDTGIPSDELPFSTVPVIEFKSTLEKCHVNMARKFIDDQIKGRTDAFNVARKSG